MKSDLQKLFLLMKEKMRNSRMREDETLTDAIVSYVRWNEIVFYKNAFGDSFMNVFFSQSQTFQAIYKSKEVFRGHFD